MSLQKQAPMVATIVASILAIIKLVFGILSGSVALMASALDSVLDMFVSIFNYFALHNAEKEPDEKFNYGLGKIEAIAAVVEGVIITISGLYILYSSIHKIIYQESVEYLDASIIVMVISVVLTALLVIFLNDVAKKTNNLVVKTDALHYKMDLFSNSAVLISLIIIYFTDLFIVDAIFGIVISVYIIYSSYELIKDGVLILLDVSLDDETIERIKKIMMSEELVNGHHYLKTRSSGAYKYVDAHVVFEPDIMLLTAHKVADNIEEKIKRIDKDTKWIITLHLDPYDDSDMHEEH